MAVDYDSGTHVTMYTTNLEQIIDHHVAYGSYLSLTRERLVRQSDVISYVYLTLSDVSTVERQNQIRSDRMRWFDEVLETDVTTEYFV